MIQIILEFLALLGIDFVDYKHRKSVEKKEKKDGVKRPFEKLFMQPSVKSTILLLILLWVGSLFFSNYRDFISYPNKTKNEIVEIREWIEKWNIEYNMYPKDLKEAVGNDPMKQSWLKDAWGREYKYYVGKGVFQILSAGKDGEFETDDDIITK